MPTLKSLLDATVKAGSKFALPNQSATSIETSFTGGSGSYTAPADGWLMVRAIITKELYIPFGKLQFYTAFIGVKGNIAFTIPLRKGQSVSVVWGTDYDGNDCRAVFLPCG